MGVAISNCYSRRDSIEKDKNNSNPEEDSNKYSK